MISLRPDSLRFLEIIVQTTNSINTTSPAFNGDDAGRSGASAVDLGKDTLISGMDAAVSTLRHHAESLPGGEAVSDAAYAAADRMERAADYLADRDIKEILSDMRQVVKKHPGATLLTAVGIGFLLARAFSRR